MYPLLVSLLNPFPWLIVGLGVVLFALIRLKKPSRLWAVSGVSLYVVLFLWCQPLVAFLFCYTLEGSYPSTIKLDEPLPVVVLSAGMLEPEPGKERWEADEITFLRCNKGAQLYREGFATPIIVSGGIVDTAIETTPRAIVMRELLLNMGIPDEDIIMEPDSRDTFENAVLSANILHDRGEDTVILVTTATHLYRASLCFQKQGIDVIPVGCDYQARKFRWRVQAFLPSQHAAVTNNRALHEIIGLCWYWLNGRV
ncbi:YdcF family protein [Calycomorphotria hydatis]|uniref:YdcF family protein n=1 Tax=Calycomorphotria hydatis TaxID=2528027 RepID=UPI0018D23099|nr:YdcF family protein [Calycomorphotria hydatis]